MKVFFLSPLSTSFRDVYEAVLVALSEFTSISIINLIDDSSVTVINPQKTIQEADLIIADVSRKSSNVFFELGIAISLQKPTIIISQKDEPILFDVVNHLIIYYDRQSLLQTLILPLRNLIAHSNTPESIQNNIINLQKEREKLKTVFVSYSHADIEYLSRLEVHLKPFEKAGQIELWSDTRIKAGEKWKDIIERALGRAAIAILLISADFLASDFIIDNELPPLLMAAEQKGTLILPVILKPCRFTRHQSLARFQAVNDPKSPMSKLSENDKEEVYVKIADSVDSLL